MSKRNSDSSGRIVLGEFGNIVNINNMDSGEQASLGDESSQQPTKRVCFELNEEPSSDVDDPECDNCSPQTNSKTRECKKWTELKKVPYELQCEWKECTFTSFVTDEFCTHVSDHIPFLDVREIEEENSKYQILC